MWRYYNSNPTKREVNDCVIRAISKAENKSWDEVYSELSTLAQEQRILLDDMRFVEPYLDSKYERICYKCDGCRMTVSEFIERNPQGTYLVTMQGHITCVKNGTLFDTWDCRDKLIWCSWEVI